MADFYVREEDGTSKYILEDGSGDLLLEGAPNIQPGFIASVTTLYAPTLPTPNRVSHLPVEVLGAGDSNARVSHTPVEVLRANTTGTLNAGVSHYPVEVLVEVTHEVGPGFIASATQVYAIYSMFSDTPGVGPGNGGEVFGVALAPNGTSETATLAADIAASATLMTLTGDSSLPAADGFTVTIDTEVLYVVPIGAGSYRIRGRALSNTVAASHTSGATVTWTDHYDLAIAAADDIAHSFTADITGSGSTTYDGWLICFDSSQAYLAGSRYPMHVTSVLGVFDAEAGSGGTNRCDAAQPNAVCTPATTSDDCPAALSNPSRLTSDVSAGDVALVRYTNPESSILVLGPRAVSLQSWFGLYRVDSSNNDVTDTDTSGNVVDGTINGEFLNPSSIGINPDDGTTTPTDVPYTTATLLATDRFFTNPDRGFSDKGEPIGVLAVRQGSRRIPFWRSWDWHNYNYVYTDFGTDAVYAQLVVNRNGIVFGSIPSVNLPNNDDITGPDAVWDDGSYYFGTSWYIALFITPYAVIGPAIGGQGGTAAEGGAAGSGFIPVVSFPEGGPTVTTPTVEGGSGGGISPPASSLGGRFYAQFV